VVRIKEIWGALDACAPGWTKRQSKEYWSIYVSSIRKEPYPTLPLGKHGNRDNPEIEGGHVRSMARFFNIVDCLKKNLPTAFQ